MKYPMSAVTQAVETLLRTGAWHATKYLTPRTIVRATRQRAGRRFRSNGMNMQITLTLGRPNYLEARVVKKARKAKEPFPIRKVQLRMLPKKKKKGK